MTRALLATVALTLLAAVLSAQSEPSVELIFEDAARLYRDQRYGAAADTFANALQSETDVGRRAVLHYDAGTAAARAGLRKGDIVTSIGGTPVKTWLEFRDLIARQKPGTSVKLKILRDGKERTVAVPLKEDKSRHGPKSSHERANLWGPLSIVRLGFEEVIQHDAIVHPRLCGSLLVDLSGNVVGLNISRSGRFETLALSSRTVAAALSRLRTPRCP